MVEVSCTADGTDIYYCSRVGCGNYEFTVEKLPHTPQKVDYLAPSCGRHDDGEGNYTYTSEDGNMPGEICSVCFTVLYGCEIIPAHNFVLASVLNPAGCLTEGEGTYVCADCEFTKTDVIAASGHTDHDLNNICEVCESFTFTSIPESLFVHISDYAGFNAIRNNLNGYYILDADIDLSGVDWTPIGTEEQSFKGIIYGNGHKITGLSLTLDGADGNTVYGLFGYNKGSIVNLTLDSVKVDVLNSNCIFGGIAAYNLGEVLGCNLTGACDFSIALKLDVKDYTHHILDCINVVGGIVGVNDQTGKVQYCKSDADVNATLISDTKISSSGALNFVMALIYNTKAETDVKVTFAAIVGRNEGEVSNCNVNKAVNVEFYYTYQLAYQKGRIIASLNAYAADLVGYNTGSVISSSGLGANYTYKEGYNILNFFDRNFKSLLSEITVTFINHGENSGYAGVIGGNDGTVIL